MSKRTTGASTGSAETYSIVPSPSKKRPTTSSPARTGAARPDLQRAREASGRERPVADRDGVPDAEVVEPVDHCRKALGRAPGRGQGSRDAGGETEDRAREPAHVCILSSRTESK